MSRNDQNSREETIDSGRQKPHPVELHEPDGSETEDDIDLEDTFMGSLEVINAVALETVDSQKLKQLHPETVLDLAEFPPIPQRITPPTSFIPLPVPTLQLEQTPTSLQPSSNAPIIPLIYQQPEIHAVQEQEAATT
ncbi:hypothetical protein Pcinc_016924 [Petrolisthes cinctipes]|uniref:Uncharacterized protein n=1 Tax=Petrolisthes cinctipes TaxID=88211 RepID=A0AAE1FQ47_PETCI|nr:hypothetical protein Pcinc_016924 [Petrolisthes cinctipes]